MNSLWAVVPAAGSGRRLGGEIPKQYREIAGAPLLEHTLRALLGSADVRGVVVALDRAEVMADAGQTAVADLAQELAAPVVSIAHVTDVIGYLQKTDAESDVLQAMHAYTRQYCVL